jgi:LacI family transcriptional regulator
VVTGTVTNFFIVMKRKTITIRGVAAAAGVSHQTVSRVINNRPDDSHKTRQRVNQIIKELGYQPSAIARSLINKRSFTLGIVTAGLQYAGPSLTLNGIIHQTEEQGYTLLLNSLPTFDAHNIQPLLNSLYARRVDGIIWAVPEISNNRDWLQTLLLKLPIPIIFLTMETRPIVSIISIDNYAGGCLAVKHLIEQGYQHIGHISGPLDWWEARQRKQAWEDTLHAEGRQTAENHWVQGNWSAKSGERAINQLLDIYTEMDAIFVANDQMALGVLKVACQLGLQVPHELAIAGFDNLLESAYYWPPLTTIKQDFKQLGSIGVHKLVEVIESRRSGETEIKPVHYSLQPELIVRGTT